MDTFDAKLARAEALLDLEEERHRCRLRTLAYLLHLLRRLAARP